MNIADDRSIQRGATSTRSTHTLDNRLATTHQSRTNPLKPQGHIMLAARHVSLAAVGLAASTLLSCAKPPAVPTLPDALPIRSVVVTAVDIPLTRTYPATIASPRTVDISARVKGWLLKQPSVDGARVAQGAALYAIDPTQYEIEVAAAKASLAQAVANAEVGAATLEGANAQVIYQQQTFDRNKDLVPTGAVSKERFDQITSQLAEAKASVAQAQAQIALAQAQEASANAQLANAQLNLSYCNVSSPLDGLLGASLQYEGSLVGGTGTTELNTVIQTDPMWAQFSPSSNELKGFNERIAAGELDGSVALVGTLPTTSEGPSNRSALTAPTVAGKVVFVNSTVGSTTSTIMMRVEFPNPTTLFRPGAYAEVTLDLGTDHDAMVVPQTAVFARQTELFVWRVKADMTVESVLVSVRTRAKDMLVIESGVAIGDRIVTEGIQKLRVGSKVAEAPASTHFTPTTSATGSTTAPAAAAPTAATAPTGKK